MDRYEGLKFCFLPFESWIKKQQICQREKRNNKTENLTSLLEMVLRINISTNTRLGWYIISQHQVVANHLPQTWKAEQTIVITCLTFHPRWATDLYADILLVKVQNIYTLAIISLAKKGVLTHKQVIKNPSHPKGVVSVSNLSYLIICVLQLAQIHPVSTFSYSISLHLLLLNWKALYFLSSTDICKIQLSHFT